MAKDHCTLSPDGWWSDCCARHDRRYANKRLTRYQADKLLYRCILRKTDCYMVAGFYFLGVRLAGWYFYDKAKKGI